MRVFGVMRPLKVLAPCHEEGRDFSDVRLARWIEVGNAGSSGESLNFLTSHRKPRRRR